VTATPVASPSTADAAPEELQVEVEGLRRRVRKGRRRSILLGNGAAAAVILGLVCFAVYYVNSELSYAKVKDVSIRRDPLDANRVIVSYRPTRSGTIGFRRTDTELLDQVTSDAVGKEQEFQWRIDGLEAGQVIDLVYRDGWVARAHPLEVPEMPSRPSAAALVGTGVYRGPKLGDGLLVGQVVNAINNEPVPGAEVHVAGTEISVRTDAEGNFRIDGAPTGPATLEISAEDFATEQLKRNLIAGGETFVRAVLSPGLEEGQIRLVLTWDREPKDLDAHLEGPLPGGEKFHVHYGRRGDLKSREYVRLDVDDRNGEGPETITVLGVQPGQYHYYVHDYTHGDDPSSNALARSGAEVRLYYGGQVYRFRVKDDAVGNVWDVCTIEVTDESEAIVDRVDTYRGAELAALGLYSKRTLADRTDWIGDYGGSEASEKAVADGLEWLARHQAPDGFWSSVCLGTGSQSRCEQPDRCTGEGDTYEMALTGLALLAFQAGGHYYFNDAKYSDVVRRGLDWMIEHQRTNGALIGSKPDRVIEGKKTGHKNHMYEHGIAAFALADAVAVAAASYQPENEAYVNATRKAVEFIEANQHLDGGWRYTNALSRPGDTSVTGWQVLALKSAKEAGIPVSNRCVENVRTFFEHRDMGANGQTGYDDPQTIQTDATTGVGMLARQFLLNEPDAPIISAAAKHLARQAEMRWGDPRGVHDEWDYYLWYNCTLGMFQVGGEWWDRWNTVIRDTLVKLQRHSGCERGSWDPNSKWGRFGGRIYSTALAILTLEVYYRYARHDEITSGETADE